MLLFFRIACQCTFRKCSRKYPRCHILGINYPWNTFPAFMHNGHICSSHPPGFHHMLLTWIPRSLSRVISSMSCHYATLVFVSLFVHQMVPQCSPMFSLVSALYSCPHLPSQSPEPFPPGLDFLLVVVSGALSLSPSVLSYFGAYRLSCWLSRYRCKSLVCLHLQCPSLHSLVQASQDLNEKGIFK